MEMGFLKDGWSAAYAKQMELAEQWLNFGIAATQRMLMAQIDGGRQLFELQGRQLGSMDEDAGGQPAMQWAAYSRRALAGSVEAGEVVLRTASNMQAEALRLVEQVVPLLNRSFMGSMEQTTRVMEMSAKAAEATRKRAA